MSNILQSVRNAALAGLALATIVSHTEAKSLPSARITERTTLGTPRSEAARISAGQESQTQRAPEPTIGKPVQVTYEDGQLTIIAENSTLSDVMKALREALGTEFDLPTSAASERIWVRLGPGPARRVLRDLLDSTEFNYVIQASDDESGIRSISLTPRSKAENPGVPDKAGASRRAVRGMSGSTASDAADPESSASQEPSTVPDPPPATPAPAPSTTDQPASTNMQAGNADLDTSKAAGPMRPEQMMQQLQSMYQQRRQIQAQQNQKASTPN